MKRMILYIFLGCVLLVAVVILVCSLLVIGASSGKTYDDVNKIPSNRYGLLLGTSPITRFGAHNLYFDTRIKATADLYKAGKINKVIASGGNYVGKEKYGCDEPAAMRDSLVSLGVPADSIILDYDGQRTLKSFDNAKNVYGLDNLTIISQKYHNSRSLYLAKHFGIDAVAYNADEPNLKTHIIKNHAREYLARVKMFIDLIRYGR